MFAHLLTLALAVMSLFSFSASIALASYHDCLGRLELPGWSDEPESDAKTYRLTDLNREGDKASQAGTVRLLSSPVRLSTLLDDPKDVANLERAWAEAKRSPGDRSMHLRAFYAPAERKVLVVPNWPRENDALPENLMHILSDLSIPDWVAIRADFQEEDLIQALKQAPGLSPSSPLTDDELEALRFSIHEMEFTGTEARRAISTLNSFFLVGNVSHKDVIEPLVKANNKKWRRSFYWGNAIIAAPILLASITGQWPTEAPPAWLISLGAATGFGVVNYLGAWLHSDYLRSSATWPLIAKARSESVRAGLFEFLNQDPDMIPYKFPQEVRGTWLSFLMTSRRPISVMGLILSHPMTNDSRLSYLPSDFTHEIELLTDSL